MIIDLEEIKRILNILIDSDKTFVCAMEFQKSGVLVHDDNDFIVEKFKTHIFHLSELELINGVNNNEQDVLKTLGLRLGGNGRAIFAAGPMTGVRITSKGRDFLTALNQKEIFNKLKTELNQLPFDMIFKMGKDLVTHVAKKKIEKIINQE